jgi:hypothetical protein
MDPAVFFTALGATAVAAIVTFVLWWRARSFLGRALQVEGKIASIEVETYEHAGYGSDHPAETTYGYRPHVAFTAGDGTRVEFKSRVAHPRSPMYSEGQAVTVVYEARDPAGTAEIKGPAVWRNTIFATIGTVILLVLTVSFKACS